MILGYPHGDRLAWHGHPASCTGGLFRRALRAAVPALLPAAILGAPCLAVEPLSLEESLVPYDGPVTEGADHPKRHGTVLCGYQGWFSHQADGNGLGNHHWSGITRNPPRCSVDLWPDLSELDPEEKFPTHFRHADGSTAYVFSSTAKPTVLRHFRWMRDYGIDGVWVQRFASQLRDPRALRRVNAVLNHCREGANRYGRSFAVMYDTGFNDRTCRRMEKDWRELLERMKILDTPAYQHHRGRPVIGLWGYGFRSFDEEACEAFFRFDEVDEGTAIFKCTNHPPLGRFVTYEGYPSDHYLRLTGRIRTLLRGEDVGFPDAQPDPGASDYVPMSRAAYYDGPYPPEQTGAK